MSEPSKYVEGVWPPRFARPVQKSSEPDASSQRKQRKAKRQEALDSVYEEVNRRDENRCRVTGVALDPTSPDDTRRREHNHIVKRSLDKTQREKADNLHLCSAHVHKLITAGKILIEGQDASLPNKLRFFWNPATPPEQRTVVIASRRRSYRRKESE